MTYDVTFVPSASEALEQLLSWAFETRGISAEAQIDQTFVEFEQELRTRPHRYHRIAQHQHSVDLRLAIVAYHRVVFAIDEGAATVEVYIIRHEKRDDVQFRQDVDDLI